MHQVIEMTCPGCGARVTTNQKECEYCHSPIVISTFNSVYSMPMSDVTKYANSYRNALTQNPENKELNNSIAMCYLKLKLYDKALQGFEKAIESNFDNTETYFYAAVCLLKGKKPFLQQKRTIDKIEEYLNAALLIEPRGIYYFFLAYIKHDYYERKLFKTTPTSQELLELAEKAGYSELDVQQLNETLGINE